MNAPEWPTNDNQPVLFLLDASSGVERELLEQWIASNRPNGNRVLIANIPPSRRRRRLHRPDLRLEAYLRSGEDPLLVPLRVVWMAPYDRRQVRWRDLFSWGDPRDPDALRQRVVLATHPEQAQIAVGAAAATSEIEDRWTEPTGRGRTEGTSLGDYVALQAWLALEKAERNLRGTRYKVPKFLREDLAGRRSFAQGVAHVSRDTGEPYELVNRRAEGYLKEMAASHSPYLIDVMAVFTRWLIERAYQGLEYDPEELAKVYELGQQAPLVFLPSHKSNFDHLTLHYVLYKEGFPPNHTAGGINMNFFPVGPIIRRAGVFFIRRAFTDNAAYKFTLRSYIAYLLEKRFPLEWYLEGGRSRTGKLRAPRFGLLAYVVDAWKNGATDDVIVVPVSIAYDQIQDIDSYAAEQRGAAKETESFGWLYKNLRALRSRYGRIHFRLGEPLSLADHFASAELADELLGDDGSGHQLDVQKLAFTVMSRVNRATPITPISLVTLALLNVDRGVTVEETTAVLEPFLEYIKVRELPTTETLALDTPERVRVALDALADNGVVVKAVGPTETVYAIGAEQQLSAAYYRNTIIHFFVNASITELALVRAGESDVKDGAAAFWDEVTALRDLLKFEFFFSERETFREEIETEVTLLDAQWEQMLASGQARQLLLRIRQTRSHAVLRPFIDAYRVVADVLSRTQGTIDKKDLVETSLAVGQQHLLRQRIKHGDSVSKSLFETASSLADHRGLLEDIDAREAFLSELDALSHRLDVIEAIEAGRRTGVFG